MPYRFAIGVYEALQLVLEAIRPLASQVTALADAVDRIAADDLRARVDSPSVDASLRDGYAVSSRDLVVAEPKSPVRLGLSGLAAAGGTRKDEVVPGSTVRVLTGARMPGGADAVVTEEDVSVEDGEVVFTAPSKAGAWILARGGEVAVGDRVAQAGDVLSPARVGLLAGAGYSHVRVIGRPVVTVVAIGDEVVAPGAPLDEGELYASNMVSLCAWCHRYGWPVHAAIVRDEPEAIERALLEGVKRGDAIITSGGAWTGDRDLVAGALERLGWRQIFRTLRMAPGKGAAFGWLQDKAVFVLPGGPPAAMIGFLQIALPGLLMLGGCKETGLPRAEARLSSDLIGRNREWTQFVFGRLKADDSAYPLFDALPRGNRLVAMAEADALAAIPEGVGKLRAGSLVHVQLLS